jgi:hypothetical protein
VPGTGCGACSGRGGRNAPRVWVVAAGATAPRAGCAGVPDGYRAEGFGIRFAHPRRGSPAARRGRDAAGQPAGPRSGWPAEVSIMAKNNGNALAPTLEAAKTPDEVFHAIHAVGREHGTKKKFRYVYVAPAGNVTITLGNYPDSFRSDAVGVLAANGIKVQQSGTLTQSKGTGGFELAGEAATAVVARTV